MSRITDREIGRTIRSRISSTVWPTFEMRKPAFFGSIRHITLTSMWTLLPSFVLKVMSSGIGRSPSRGVRVHQEVLLGDGERRPGVDDRQDHVDAARRVDLLGAPLLEDAEEVRPHADLGGVRRPAAGEAKRSARAARAAAARRLTSSPPPGRPWVRERSRG